ncbi:methyltransferase domain-containing protein [Streptomyces sp. NPDC048304]|uniref:methyltransferase domain-containing protein n=1 Tax=Streptomyces sp. NPDC048304 TaxID=3154820 RepID=UPI0034105821
MPSRIRTALEASAESIPLADDSADAAMALLTVHHWSDLEAGIGELLRIARQPGSGSSSSPSTPTQRSTATGGAPTTGCGCGPSMAPGSGCAPR